MATYTYTGPYDWLEVDGKRVYREGLEYTDDNGKKHVSDGRISLTNERLAQIDQPPGRYNFAELLLPNQAPVDESTGPQVVSAAPTAQPVEETEEEQQERKR